MISTTNTVVESVKYVASPAVNHDGVLRIPAFVRASGMKIPAAPSMVHQQCTISDCTNHLSNSGTDPAALSHMLEHHQYKKKKSCVSIQSCIKSSCNQIAAGAYVLDEHDLNYIL